MTDTVRGHFTIDLARAREKLGRYQLADPYAYVLEFVQAAGLRGAERVEIFVDSDDLKLTFAGRPFTEDELHNLELAVLDHALTPEQRSRRRMAMGLLALQSLHPALIAIESGAGLRWERRKGKAATLKPRGGGDRNLIHVRMPWSMAALMDRFRARSTLRPEEVLLRKQCRTTRMEIVHNGEKLSSPPTGDDHALAVVPIEAEGVRGWGGLVPGSQAGLTLVLSGVTVETVPLDLGKVPFQAVLESSLLSTDISGTSVQKDAVYDHILELVKQARQSSLARLEGEQAERYADEIRAELFSHEKILFQDDMTVYPQCLLRLPIWKLSDGRPCSVLDLRQVVELAGYLPYCIELHLDQKLEQYAGVLHADHATQSSLVKLLGWSSKNVTRRLRQQAEALRSKAAWKARPAGVGLTGSTYLKRATFAVGSTHGEVAVKDAPEPALLRIIVEGCLLCELSPAGWPGGLEASLAGDFDPNRAYDGLDHNESSVRGLLEICATLRRLYEELASAGGEATSPLLAEFLAVASRPEPVRFLLEACGVPLNRFSGLLAAAEWTPLEQQPQSPLLDVAWVKTEGERRLSVREIQKVRERQKESDSTLVISESQKGTLERLLGESLWQPEGSSQSQVTFRLDPEELREERFLAALRRELSRVTGQAELRLGGFNLSRLVLAPGSADRVFTLHPGSGAVHLHRAHPLVQEANQAGAEEPTLLLLLVSVLFSAINQASAQVSDARELELQQALAEYLITSPARLAAESQVEPAGVLEPVCHSGFCAGWANDPAGLGLRLYFQTPTAAVEPDAILPLDSPRAEGGHHFLYDLPPSARSGQKVLIHACLVHPEDGRLVELDGSPRAYAEPHRKPAKPVGRVLEVSAEGVCRGWCVDPNNPQGEPQVEFYLDGNWQAGEWIGLSKANHPNAELREEIGFRGDHEFRFSIPPQYRDGCRHTLYVYGFDLEGTAGNPLLQDAPLEFLLPARYREGDDAWERGRQAVEKGRFESAIADFQLRLEKGGDRVGDDEVWSWLGAAYSALELLEKSDEAFDRAVSLGSANGEHWYLSALCKFKLGEDEEGLRRLRKAVFLEPEGEVALLELAHRTDSTSEAVALWERLLELPTFSNPQQAYNALLELHCQAGAWERAAQCLQAARQAGCVGLEEVARRVAEAEAASVASPPASAADEEALAFARARDLLDQKEYEGALRLLQNLAARGRFNGPLDRLWAETARAQIGLLRFAEGAQSLRKALAYNPDSVLLLCRLGWALEQDGDDKQALTYYQEAVKVAPEAPEGYLALGAYHARRGETQPAIEAYEQCRKVDTGGRFQAVEQRLQRLREAQAARP